MDHVRVAVCNGYRVGLLEIASTKSDGMTTMMGCLAVCRISLPTVVSLPARSQASARPVADFLDCFAARMVSPAQAPRVLEPYSRPCRRFNTKETVHAYFGSAYFRASKYPCSTTPSYSGQGDAWLARWLSSFAKDHAGRWSVPWKFSWDGSGDSQARRPQRPCVAHVRSGSRPAGRRGTKSSLPYHEYAD